MLSTLLREKKLTKYAGLSPIMNYINKLKIGEQINELFPTEKTNAHKFSNTQILLSLLLASLAGINRVKRIAKDLEAEAKMVQHIGLLQRKKY